MNFIKRLIDKRKREKELEKRIDECWFNCATPDGRTPLGIDGAETSPNFYDAAYTNQIAKR